MTQTSSAAQPYRMPMKNARYSGNPVWYQWVVVYFLLSVMQAFGFIDRLLYGSWEGKGGDKVTVGLSLLLIVSSVIVFSFSYLKTKGLGPGGILILVAISYLSLDAAFSIDSSATLRQSIIYFFVALGAIGIAGTMSPDQYMRLLSLSCFLSAAASLGLLIVAHGTAVSEFGDFQGIFAHKNFLGQVMATGALATLHGIRVDRQSHRRNIVFLALFVGMAVASKSATSWLTIGVFCSMEIVVALWKRGGVSRVFSRILAALLVPTLLFAAFEPDAIFALIGKDPSLTGRTEIWEFVMHDITLKPLLGWGYFAFWGPNNPAAIEISDAVHWMVPQAHNGLLEMLLSIGFVGTAIFVFLLARTIVLATKCLQTPAQELAISTLLCCTGILLLGVSEFVLLAPTQPSSSMFLITTLMCNRANCATKRSYHMKNSRLVAINGTRSASRI